MTPATTSIDDQPNSGTPAVPASKSRLIKLGELITTQPDNLTDLGHQLTDAAYLTLSMISYVKNCEDNVSASAANADYNHFIKNSGHKPEDLLIMLSSLLLMIGLAILASKMLNFKRVQIAWKYIRDMLSGLKNGRTAFVNTNAQITPLFHHHILHYGLANPIGIGIGLALVPALLTYRYLNSQRDNYIQHNENIIKAMLDNTYESLAAEKKSPLTHGAAKQTAMIMLSFFDAITDAPYMFSAITLIILNLAGLSAVTMGAPIIVLATILVVYTLSSLFTKAYTEIQKQKKLQKSADEVSFEKLNNKATTPGAELEKFKVEFKKKYGVQPGEVSSRILLEKQSEYFKKWIDDSCGITDKNNTDLLLEKQLSLINQYTLQPIAKKDLDYNLQDNVKLQDKSFNPNLDAIIQNHPLHDTSITTDKIDEDINKIKAIILQHQQYCNRISQNSIGTSALPQKSEQVLELERSLDYLQQYRSLIEARNNLITQNISDHSKFLTLKAYYAAIIKAENTLSETCGYTTDNMPLDSKEETKTTEDLNLKLQDIKTTLKTLSAYNPFTYQRAQRLQQEYRLLKNIQLLVDITHKLENSVTNMELTNINTQFKEHYAAQKAHLNNFRVTPPLATKLSTLWRCLRSFIMAPKNIMNTIDGAIGDVVSGIAGPIIKYGILLPLSTLYGWYLTKQQKKECQKEGPAKSPTLFAHTPDKKKPENPGAAATMHLL